MMTGASHTPADVPCALDIVLESDAAFGRGEGLAGHVDVEVEHDESGIPIVGGKTLHGLLRDAWLHMAEVFDELHPAAVTVLGTGGSTDAGAILRVGDAEVDPLLRDTVRDAVDADRSGTLRSLVLEASTVIRSQTARTRTGEPVAGSLRSIRAVRRGTRLRAPLRWKRRPDEMERRVLAMAAAGVRSAGLGRTRGLGRLAIELVEGEWREALTLDLPASDDPPWKAPATYLPLVLTLGQPAIFTRPGGGNRVQTYDRIPGAAIRGAVAWAVRAAGGSREDAVQAELEDLVFHPDVRYLDGHPESPATRGHRALPASPAWRVRKSELDAEDQIVLDLTAGEGHGELEEPTVPVSTSASAWVAGDGAPIRVSVARRARLHTARDRIAGRAWLREVGGQEQPEGALFSYESVARGERFVALVQLRGDRDERRRRAERLAELLAPGVLLGRSRGAEYGGLATIKLDSARRDEEPSGEAVRRGGVRKGDTLVARLTSPYVGRDPDSGQLDPAWLAHELTDRLPKGSVGEPRVLASYERVGGFDRRWGLPTPVALAASGGSQVVFPVSADIPGDALDAIAAGGLGERRELGLGRVTWLRDPPRQWLLGPVRGRQPARRALAASVGDELLDLELRIAALLVDRRISLVATELSHAATRVPSGSLLGRLRTPLLDAEWADTLQTWLGDGERALKRPARTAVQRCRFDASGLPASVRDGARRLERRQLSLAGLLADLAHPADRRTILDNLLDRRAQAATAALTNDSEALESALEARSEAHARRLALELVSRLGVRAALADRPAQNGGERR